ncbi:hypothetical protein DXG01_016345 [Tephrocybe rancida]|nr:hypothetical protein DXG01_016345 [Tephrocybe rancida]
MANTSLTYTISPIATLQGHAERAWNIAWNPTRPILASCSADKTVRMYTYSGDELKFTHLSTLETGHTKSVRALAWAPSGKTLATASFDSNIGIWEQENGGEGDEDGAVGEWECVSQLEGHETECKSVAYSSTGTLLASCSRDKTVWVWEVHPDADFECMGVLMDHSQDVKCVAWHPSEEILASASYDDTIKLYIDDPSDDWFCFATLSGHTSTVWSVVFSPDGRYLASASDDRTVRIWQRVDEARWESVLLLGGHERSVYSLSWGVGTGKGLGWLASSGSDGVIQVWELSDSKSAGISAPRHELLARVANAHDVYDVNTVSWCPRAGHTNLLASAGDDGNELEAWYVNTANCEKGASLQSTAVKKIVEEDPRRIHKSKEEKRNSGLRSQPLIHVSEELAYHEILWLLEELGLEYELKHYQRDSDLLAPKELLEISPLGKSPVITDGSVNLAESGAIIEYLITTYGNGKFQAPTAGQGYLDNLYYTHYAEGSLMPLLVSKLTYDIVPSKTPFFVRPIAQMIFNSLTHKLLVPAFANHFGMIEKHLNSIKSGWFAGGDEPTAADFLMVFPLEAVAVRAPEVSGPKLTEFVNRVHARPAYKRALEKGGEYAYV